MVLSLIRSLVLGPVLLAVILLVSAHGSVPAFAEDPLAAKELEVERQIGCPI